MHLKYIDVDTVHDNSKTSCVCVCVNISNRTVVLWNNFLYHIGQS